MINIFIGFTKIFFKASILAFSVFFFLELESAESQYIYLLVLICFLIIWLFFSKIKNTNNYDSSKSTLAIIIKLLFLSLTLMLAVVYIPLTETTFLKNYGKILLILLTLSTGLLVVTHFDRLTSCNVDRKSYKESFISIVLLAIIISFSLYVKVPYLEYPFTGEHTMKYNTYVEPALYMVEKDSPFVMQTKYYIDPIENPMGIYDYFWVPPIIPWGLFVTYKLLPGVSVELATRIFTSLVGVLILITSYLLARKFTNNVSALVFVALLAINPIIQFIGFVTVIDSILLLFMLLSMRKLYDWYVNSDHDNLIYAGLLYGIGNSFKYSLTFWYLPFVFLLIFTSDSVWRTKIVHFILFNISAAIPFLIAQSGIRFLPSLLYLELIILFLWSLLLFVLFKYREELYEKVETVTNILLKSKKIISLIATFGLSSLGVILYFINNNSNLLQETLTDRRLFLNFDLYQHIIIEQVMNYATTPLFIIGLIGIIFSVFLYKYSVLYKFTTLYFIGILIYIIATAKVLFFHNYYTTPIMLALALGGFSILHMIVKIYENDKLRILIITICVTFLLLPATYNANVERFSKYRGDVYAAAKYMSDNNGSAKIYIDDSYTLSLTILTGISRIEPGQLAINDELKKMVDEKGFSETMNSLGVKYLVSTRQDPDYSAFLPLFTNKIQQTSNYQRTNRILATLDPETYTFPTDLPLRQTLLNEVKIDKYFSFEKEVGGYYFYRCCNVFLNDFNNL